MPDRNLESSCRQTRVVRERDVSTMANFRGKHRLRLIDAESVDRSFRRRSVYLSLKKIRISGSIEPTIAVTRLCLPDAVVGHTLVLALFT